MYTEVAARTPTCLCHITFMRHPLMLRTAPKVCGPRLMFRAVAVRRLGLLLIPR